MAQTADNPCLITYDVKYDSISSIAGLLQETGVLVIGSHAGSREEDFFSDLILYFDSLNIETHVWDFTHYYIDLLDDDVFRCRARIHDIPLRRDAGKWVDHNALFSEILSLNKESVVLLIGLQKMQHNPFDPQEAEVLMDRLRNAAADRTILVYSRLYSPLIALDTTGMREEDYIIALREMKPPAVEDLEKLGIKSDRTILLE